MSEINPAVDKLFQSVSEKGHVCVGLDTSLDYIPTLEREKARNGAEAAFAFNKAIIDATYDIAACFKVQIAYYEELGVDGLSAYSRTLKYIREKNCLSIGDIKRGDIADTAKRYAKAHFSGDFKADFVTLSPYMGMDSIEPWLNEALVAGGGAFIITRTSNPGMRDFEYLELKNGNRLYNAIGDKMSLLARKYHGKKGFGLFGIVVGCTEKEEAAEIREKYSNLFFLIPGYGAQGGGAKDAASLLVNGNGGVVNASRSIITAWRNPDWLSKKSAESADNAFAAEAARDAAIKTRDDILRAIL